MVSRFSEKTYLFIILLLAFILFGKSILYYFFQDDWLVLNLINYLSIKDLPSLFLFRTDVIYYRPVGMFTFFYLSKLFFGLNPLSFHLITFSIFLSNIVILFQILKKIFKNNKAALFAVYFYATASFHFMSLSWLSLTWNIIGSFFFLLAAKYYVSSTSENRTRNNIISISLFCLALASTEFAISFPIFIVLCDFIVSKKILYSLQKGLTVTLISIFIIIVYLMLKFFVFAFPVQNEYKISLDIVFIKNLFWYFAWLINVPDEFKFQIVILKLQITESLLSVSKYLIYTILLLPITFMLGTITLLHNSIKNNLIIITVTFMSFTIILFPVLFLSNHSFSYYLEIASLPFILLICKLYSETIKNKLSNKYKVIITSIILIVWFTSSFFTIRLNRKIHWMTAEQNISRNAVEIIKSNFPYLPSNSVVYIKPSSIQLDQSLMGVNALQVIYKDKTINTIFLEDKHRFQSGGKNDYYVNLKF